MYLLCIVSSELDSKNSIFVTNFIIMSRGLSLILFMSLVLWGCYDTEELTDVEFTEDTRSIAFPLINTAINVVDFEKQSDSGNVTVSADNEGRVTVKYDGEVVSRDWSIISPPLPIAAFAFEDSIENIVINKPDGSALLQDEIVNRIEFDEWNIKYLLSHDFDQDISVTFTIPQILKDGVPYQETFTVTGKNFQSESFPLSGYHFETVDNEFVIMYDARLPDGTRIEFNLSSGLFQPFNPSLVRGYLGKGEFPVQGNIVPVNLFSAWKSGGVVFENPVIDIYIENALGIPLTTDIKEFSITTVEGVDIDIESEAIDNGIDIDYPTWEERGEAKITRFNFNRDNSNLKELFAERVKRVNYKINSLYNEEESGDQTQFVGEGGYFSANVSVVLPLEGLITDLVLNDTIDLDLTDYDNVIKGEIKTVITNEFPLSLDLQAYFIDAQGQVIDSLYTDGFLLEGTEVDSDGRALESTPQSDITTISADRWEAIRQSTRLAFDIKLNTKTINESPLWVYDKYDILVKIGAILDVNINK